MSRILVVDDDESILQVISIILKEFGHKVFTTKNGNQTFKKIKTYKPNLVILDILLAGIDGREICKKIKRDIATKKIPVVLISAQANISASALKSGANAFLAKPFKMDDLINTINIFI
jgi:CheY-like chemotaxis protein